MLRQCLHLLCCAAAVVVVQAAHRPVAVAMDEQQAVLQAESSTSLNNCTRFVELPRDETKTGDVFFQGDLSLHPEAPRFLSLNQSTWDYWLFYAVSEDGKSGYSTSLFRDGSGPSRGGTNFRYMMEILLSDGSTHTSAAYFDHADLEMCDHDTVKGVWKDLRVNSETPGNSSTGSISFEIVGEQITTARFEVDLPDVHGKLEFRTRATPVFAGGGTYPLTRHAEEDVANAVLAPGMWWETPMLGADVSVDVHVTDKGHLAFAGRGGHDRIWSTLTWPQLARSWIFVRATIGPYAIALCQVVSAVAGGARYQAANLQRDRKVVFSSRSDNVSLTRDHAVIRPTYDGQLKGQWRDASTGYVLDMISPRHQKHWQFEMRHYAPWWSSPTGRGGTGNVGFIDRIAGGEVDKEEYQDWGLVSSIEFP